MFGFKKKSQPPEVNESAVRIMLDKAGNHPYEPIESLVEAKKAPDSYVVMEGDYGGQVYLSVPVGQIACNEAALRELLVQLDNLAWAEPEGATLYYEKMKPGQGIPGGMSGGIAGTDLWLHPKLKAYRSLVQDYLDGKITSIRPIKK